MTEGRSQALGNSRTNLRTKENSGRPASVRRKPEKKTDDFETAVKRRETAAALAEGMALLAAGAYFFYRSWYAFLAFSPLLPVYCRMRRRQFAEKRREELTLQFKEAITAVCVSMQAGYSAENAFVHAEGEMRELFGEQSAICRELRRINRAVENNIPLEQVLTGMAAGSKVTEIEDFAQAFLLGKRSGGDMHKIIQGTVSLISEKIEMKRDIATVLSAKRLELKVMSVVPFGILLYIGTASPGFFGPLYHNPMGVTVMSGCLALYVGGVLLGRKILSRFR